MNDACIFVMQVSKYRKNLLLFSHYQPHTTSSQVVSLSSFPAIFSHYIQGVLLSAQSASRVFTLVLGQVPDRKILELKCSVIGVQCTVRLTQNRV
jgi:hypothetical protein